MLTFPEGALLTEHPDHRNSNQRNTGLPEGAGPTTGLILQPDGLELAATATLEIKPKTSIPPESRLHWGFYEDGKDAFLHIPVQDTDAIVIPIDHFSGAGIGFADRVNLQLDRWRQTAIEDRLTTRIAEELRLDRAGLPGRDSTATMRAIVEARAAVEAGQSAIAFHPAATCEDAKRALQTILQLISRIQPLSFDGGASDDGSTDLIWKLFHRATSLCVDEALKVCLMSGDLSPLTALAVEYRRILQNLSATGANTPEEDMNGIDPEVRAAMERCGRYKLTAQAKGHWVDGVGVYGDVSFKVEVPIRIKFSFSDSIWEYELVGEAPATDVNITFCRLRLLGAGHLPPGRSDAGKTDRPDLRQGPFSETGDAGDEGTRALRRHLLHHQKTRQEDDRISGVGKHLGHRACREPVGPWICAENDEGRIAPEAFQLQLGWHRDGRQRHLERYHHSDAGAYRGLTTGRGQMLRNSKRPRPTD